MSGSVAGTTPAKGDKVSELLARYSSIVDHYYTCRWLGDSRDVSSVDAKFWVMRLVPNEKAPILFDEYEDLFGERREDIIDEEIRQERSIYAHHLTVGEDLMTFTIFSPAGTSKTCLLLYIHRRISLHLEQVVQEVESDSSTLYYSLDNHLKFKPPRLLSSIYVEAHDLESEMLQNELFVDAVEKAAWRTFAREFQSLPVRGSQMNLDFEFSESEFKSLLRNIMATTKIVLLVDCLDSVIPEKRFNFISKLHAIQKSSSESINERERYFFHRILITSRPVSLCRIRTVPKVVYLYLEPSVGTIAEKISFISAHYPNKSFSLPTKEQELAIFRKNLHHLTTPLELSYLAALMQEKMAISAHYGELWSQIWLLIKKYKYDDRLEKDDQQLIKFFGFLGQCYLSQTLLLSSPYNFKAVVLNIFQILLKAKIGLFKNYASQDDTIDYATIIWDRVKQILTTMAVCRFNENDGVCFVSDKIVHFLTAGFFCDVEFSVQVLSHLEQVQFEPKIFSWGNSNYFANKNWENVFFLISSVLGTQWLSRRIVGNLNEYLLYLKTSGGKDINDLGQIRFSLLLRSFALQLFEMKITKVEPSSHTLSLVQAFGSAFLSILECSASAIIHLENFPVYTLSCFTEDHIAQIVEKCTILLRRNSAFVIGDLLMRFIEHGIFVDEIVNSIRALIFEDNRARTKRPSLRFLKEFTLKQEGKKPLVKIIVEALGEKDEEMVDEAHSALKAFAEQSLQELAAFKFQQNGEREIEHSLLFSRGNWNLIFYSSLSLLNFLILHKYHIANNPATIDQNLQKLLTDKQLPSCRYFQAKHLPYILSLLETSHFTRLLAHVLLSDISSEYNTKNVEETKIQSVVLILENINIHWRCKKPEAEIINEITKTNPLMQLVCNIIAETLGGAAAESIFLLEDIVRRKLDFLSHCLAWIWRVLPKEKRIVVVRDLSNHRNVWIKASFIELEAKHKDKNQIWNNMSAFEFDDIEYVEYDLENETEKELDAEIRNMILVTMKNYKENPNIIKLCFTYLENVLKYSEDYGSTVGLIAEIFEVHGFSNPVISEPLLRIMKEALETRETKERKVLVDLVEKCNLKQSIIKHLQKKSRKQLWYGMILVAELLRYLIQPDKPESDVFLAFLSTQEAQLRHVAVSVLKKAKLRGKEIADAVFTLMLKEENCCVLQSYMQVLGFLGRNDNLHPHILNHVKKLLTLKHPKPEIGVGILGTMRIHSPEVSQLLQNTLRDILKDNKLYSSSIISLLITIVNSIAEIGFSNYEMVDYLFKILALFSTDELRVAIYIGFKKLVPLVNKADLPGIIENLNNLLQSKDPCIRETTLKILRSFGLSEIVDGCRGKIIESLSDSHVFCRKQSLKIIHNYLLHMKSSLSTEEFSNSAVFFLPIIIETLKDSTDPAITAQALKLISIFKIKNLSECTDGLIDEDTFYLEQVINPNVEIIRSILTGKNLKLTKDIKVEILSIFGETDHLSNFIGLFKPLLNSDQISTLVEFAEALVPMGPKVLQYIPHLLSQIQSPGSPLVRHLVRFIQKFSMTIQPITCKTLFTTTSLNGMLKHRDPSVRRVALQLISKKINPSDEDFSINFQTLLQVWADKNSKVKKEVMDALGNFGKNFPDYLPKLMESQFLEDVNSIIVWRNLSYAWRCLVKAPL